MNVGVRTDPRLNTVGVSRRLALMRGSANRMKASGRKLLVPHQLLDHPAIDG